jgi:hypothetical protein
VKRERGEGSAEGSGRKIRTEIEEGRERKEGR